MAQRRGGLVPGPQMRSEGEALPPLPRQPQEGGRQAGVLQPLYADGLPGQGVQGHTLQPGGGVQGRRPAPDVGADEPPHGGDGGRQERGGVRRGRRRRRSRGDAVGGPAGGGAGGPGAGHGPAVLRRRHGHRSSPGPLHDGQRQAQRGADIPGQMPQRDAPHGLRVQDGRGPQDPVMRPARHGGHGGRRRIRRDGGELEDGPGPEVPIRGSCSSSDGRCPRCRGP